MQPNVIANRYSILERVSEDRLCTLYKALNQQQKQPVILKVFNESIKQKSLETLLLFERELGKLSRHRHPNSVDIYEVGEDEGVLYLVQEHVEGGFTLSSQLRYIKDIDTAVDLILQVSAGLDSAHQQGILHRMINPDSIVLFKTDHKITAKVTDFGAGLLIDLASIRGEDEIIRAFGYLSPEATGILRKPVDERSDIYSLGILFYQLLTGELPYRAKEISTLIHQHIAQKPKPPTERNRAVPKVIEEIVLRLIAKNPFDRYQSLSGLMVDLKEYKKQRAEGKEVVTFEIAKADRLKELTYTTRFIGRQREVKALRQLIDESTQKKGRVCFVYGEPGVGKSRLLDELRGYIHSVGGVIIGGRSSQSDIKTPYEVFSEATNAYVEKVKRRSKKEQEELITRIKESVGELGQEVVKIAPSIKDLIGEPPELVALEPERERIRFIITVTSFLVNLATPHIPVILLLDDFQWVDEGSLELFEILAEEAVNAPLFLIASYRDPEQENVHAVMRTLETLRGKRAKVYEIHVEPFTIDETSELVSQMLMEQQESVKPLTEHIHNRTEGNPFFIIELLHSLVEQGVVYFIDNHYQYDLNKIKDARLPTNIVDVILNRIKDISKDEQKVLSYASVMGRHIAFETLIGLPGMSEDVVLNGIEKGIRDRFVARDLTGAERLYFAHDRIREAFYTRLPQEERIPLHKHIGEILEREHKDAIDSILYELAYHFTQAHIEDKTLLYSMKAGKKAQNAYAHDQAARFYEKAKEILEKQKNTNTDEYIDLLENLAETYRAAGRLDEALDILYKCEQLIPEEAMLLRAEVLSKVGDTLWEKGEGDRATDIMGQALKSLGVKLPQHSITVGMGIVREFFVQILHTLFPGVFVRKEYKDDQKAAVILRLLLRTAYFYYFTDMIRCLHLAFKYLNMGERMGPSRTLSNIYDTFCVIWSGIPFPSRAKKDGERAIKIAQDLKDRAAEGSACAYHAVGTYCNRSVEESYEYAKKSVDILKGIGEYWDLGMATWYVITCQLLQGEKLERLLEQAEEMIKTAQGANSLQTFGWGLYHKARILAYIGDERLKTEGIKAGEESVKALKKAKDNPNCLHARSFLAFAYLRAQRYDEAIRVTVEMAELYPKHNNKAGFIHDVFPLSAQVYLESAQHMPNLTEDVKKEYLKKAGHFCEKAFRLSKKFPYIRSHSYQVNGTYQWLSGEKGKAVELWEQGIKYLREHTKDTYRLASILHEEASFLINDNPQDTRAKEYLIEAKDLFSQLGAKLDVENINKLLTTISPEKEAVESRQALTLTRQLDSLLSVTKVIGSIFVLEELLDKIVEQAMKVTGAERGFLLLYDEKDNTLKEKVSRGIEEALTKLPFSYENYKLSLNMIQEVEKEGQGLFAGEESATLPQVSGELKEYKVKEAMCVPLKTKDKPLGMIYLDNRLAGGTFGQDELELMKSFAIQASVSIENVYLVRDLIESEEKYRLISENASDLIAVTTLDGRYTYVSQSHRQYGYEPEKLLGSSWLDLVYRDDREWMKALMKEYSLMSQVTKESGEGAPLIRNLEYRFVTQSGEWRHIGSTVNLIFDSLGTPTSFLVVSRDITERKKVSEELERHRDQLMREIEEHKRTEEELRLYHDKLRSVSSELFLTEERERRQIASDLHDRIGQSLAMSKIALGALKQSVSSNELADAVDKIHKLIEQTIQDTRTLTFEISPPVLYELGLEAALEWLVKQFRIQYNLKISFENDGQPKPMDESLRVIIFRAVRELLVNITKHARAQNVELSIRRDGGKINITVQDDGIGLDSSTIDYDTDKTKGFGIFSIRDRLSHLGGYFDIASQPGKGTRVTLVSPLRQGDEIREEKMT